LNVKNIICYQNKYIPITYIFKIVDTYIYRQYVYTVIEWTDNVGRAFNYFIGLCETKNIILYSIWSSINKSTLYRIFFICTYLIIMYTRYLIHIIHRMEKWIQNNNTIIGTMTYFVWSKFNAVSGVLQRNIIINRYVMGRSIVNYIHFKAWLLYLIINLL